MRYPYEAWGKEVSDFALRFKEQTYFITTGNIQSLYNRKQNAVIVKHSPFLFWLFVLLSCRYSRICRLSMLELGADTPYFTWLVGMMEPEKTVYRIRSSSWIDGNNGRRLARKLRAFKLVVVQDNKCREAVARYVPEDQVVTVPTGIDLSRFAPSDPPQDRIPFKILFASGPLKSSPYPDIFKWKGIDLLLESIWLLQQEGLKVNLTMAWREAYLPQIRSLIEGRGLANVSIFDGFVDMMKLYEECHATIFPAATANHSPCFPSTLMESLSVGRPVVVTDVIHMSELVKETKSGVVCGPNAEQIAKAIRELMSKYQEFQSNCVTTASENFDIIRNHRRLASILGLENYPEHEPERL